MGDLFSMEISDRHFFLARGKFRFKDIDSIDLSKILSSLILTDKTIRESYHKYANEGIKILGQEKALLLEKVTNMIIYVVELRWYFEKKVFNQNIADVYHPDQGFEMKIYFKSHEFTINGFFSQKLFERLSGFSYWEEKHFWPLYDKLLQTIKMAISDGIITEDEGRMVTNLLDEMLHLLLILFNKLESEYLRS